MSELEAVGRPAPRRLPARARTVVVVAAVAVAILSVAFVVDQPLAGSALHPDSSGGSGQVGQPATELTLVAAGGSPVPVTTVDGAAVSLAALKGKAVWLTFGASWCPDCRAEASDIEAVFAAHQAQGLAIVAVMNEDAAPAKSYAAKVGFTFPIVADSSGDIGDVYHVIGLPKHVFIGRDGTIRDVRIGRLNPEEMEQLVSGLLAN